MIIRNLSEPEIETARQLCFTAFEANIDGAASPAASADRILHQPKTRMHRDYRNTLAAFDENGSMQACVSHCLCPVYFDGNTAQMAAVGDVAALPACRGKGVMKALFSTLLNRLHQQQIPFSYLYPFSGTYYAQYGYSYCVKHNQWTLSLASLPAFPEKGSIRLWNPSLQKPVQEIYEQFCSHINLAVRRESIEWLHAIGQFEPSTDHIFTYVYFDEADEALAYMTYQKKQTQQGNVMFCREFFYKNLHGLKGLLNFCRSRKAYYESVCFSLPESVPLELILSEFQLPRLQPAEIRQRMHGMVRVIDPKAALSLASFSGNGQLSLWLTDSLLPQNTGMWQITWEHGRAVSIRTPASPCCAERTEAETDMSLDIGLFSRLLCSGISAQGLALLPEETIRCKNEAILSCFPLKTADVFEYF
ncbi:MAG: GNAT family N-acetyltransferase [Lachnospiraceae bacterium]|nr:GNAT family N-acetyltransferase [Lachnospiraceae bacterium]